MASDQHKHGSTPCQCCGRERDYERGTRSKGLFFCSLKCSLLFSLNAARKRNQNALKNLTALALKAAVAAVSALFGITASVASAAARLTLLCFITAIELFSQFLRIAVKTTKTTVIFSLRLARSSIRLAAEALVEIYKYLYCEYISARPKVKTLLGRLRELAQEFARNAPPRIANEVRIFIASFYPAIKEARYQAIAQAALLTSIVMLITVYYQNSQYVKERKNLIKYAPNAETAVFETIVKDSAIGRLKPLSPEQIASLISKPEVIKPKDLKPVVLQLPRPLVKYVSIEPPPVPIRISIANPTVTYTTIEPVRVPIPKPAASYTAIEPPLVKINIPEPKASYTEIRPTEPAKAPEIKLASIEITKPIAILPPKNIPLSPPDVLRGPLSNKRIVITFDGGSEDSGATTILDSLKAHGIKTTMFLTGEFIRRYPDAVRRMVAEGHEIGNHTLTHPHLTNYENTRKQDTLYGVNREFLKYELLETARIFKMVTGTPMAPLWRAPYGEVNSEIRAWAYDAGFIHIGWTSDPTHKESLDTLDWVADKSSRLYRTSGEIKDRILNFGKNSNGLNGGIILMHLGSTRKDDRAEDVLHNMIEELVARGYEFVKVTALLETIAPIQPYLDEGKLYAMKKEAAK